MRKAVNKNKDLEILQSFYKRMRKDKKLDFLRKEQQRFVETLDRWQAKHFEKYFYFVLMDIHFRNISLINYTIKYLKLTKK